MTKPSIRTLLLFANGLLLLVPLFAIAGLRLYDIALLRQTERQLIAESVLTAEVFRDAYAASGGAVSGTYRPAPLRDRRYTPIEPVIDIGAPVLGVVLRSREGRSQDPAAAAAGHAIEPMMRRAQTFNLSGVRVLDAEGCVVATTRSQEGECLDLAPEVKRALSGHYAASLRERISDEPKPPLGDLRRRGGVRVFTALPIWHGERVIGVVTASRTGLDALSSLWLNRREIVLLAAGALALVLFVALLSSWAIARPLRRLTELARSTVAGVPSPTPEAFGWAPQEIQVLSDALREMTARLHARAEHAAEQSAHVSHELKTPLAAIRGAVELLRDHAEEMPLEQRQRFIANIDADAERMERLITRLLTLARIESEAGRASEPVDVERAVRSWLERHGDVVIEIAAPLGTLQIREDHLASVVLNLVENAQRHGNGQPVTVRLARDGARLRIEVIDHGPGIREANRSRLFDRFFTTERDRGGTGLGLSIVKAVADARGGAVAVESRPGQTCFRVTL